MNFTFSSSKIVSKSQEVVDFNRVLSEAAKNIKKYFDCFSDSFNFVKSGQYTCIAGSFVLHHVLSEYRKQNDKIIDKSLTWKSNDVDIFMTRQQLRSAEHNFFNNHLDSEPFYTQTCEIDTFNRMNNILSLTCNSQKFQLINKDKIYSSDCQTDKDDDIFNIIDGFDISCCMFAYYDGKIYCRRDVLILTVANLAIVNNNFEKWRDYFIDDIATSDKESDIDQALDKRKTKYSSRGFAFLADF